MQKYSGTFFSGHGVYSALRNVDIVSCHVTVVSSLIRFIKSFSFAICIP